MMNPAVLIASVYVFALAAFLGLPAHQPRPAAFAYAAHVRNQCDLRHFADRIAGAGGSQGLSAARAHSRLRCGHHRDRQRGRRLRHYRPHAQDVSQARRRPRRGLRNEPHLLLHGSDLPGRLDPLHSVAQDDVAPRYRAARNVSCRRRHVRGHRRHAHRRPDRYLDVAHRRPRHRLHHWRLDGGRRSP